MALYNETALCGVVSGTPQYLYECYGRRYCRLLIAVPRLSGAQDLLPVHFLEEQYLPFLEDGEPVHVLGSLRSCNRESDGRSHLIVYVAAVHLKPCEDVGENSVILSGVLQKGADARLTPFGRCIADVLVKTTRRCRRSDYLPVICWGAAAQHVSSQPVGTGLCVTGRFQSRLYDKRQPDGSVTQKTAYEVSAARIEIPYPPRA